MLLVPSEPLPDLSWAISQFSPFSTVFLYLVPNLCVSPAARKGSSARPTAATLSLLDPSNSHEPSLSCLRASQASPRATAASDSALPPPDFSSLSLVAPLRPFMPGTVNAPPPPDPAC